MATLNINDIIIRPIITEKTNSQMTIDNQYTLEVHQRATRSDIKRAVEYIFAKSGAKVKKVNIIKVKRKPKTIGKYSGYKKGYKKAIVILSAGSIPIYGASGIDKKTGKPKKGLKIIDTEKIMQQAEKQLEKKGD